MCRSRFISAVVVLLVLGLLLGAKSKKPDANAPAVPPTDAQWTIYCQAISGPDHVARAIAAKQQLLGATALKDWYVIHQDDQSVIYYGFYRTINDPKDKKESERAQNDRKALLALTDQLGNKILSACMFVEAASPDPTAPPEWDVRNAGGYWTLEIAMYKEHPQRKQAAVDAVREARAQGVDAYYFHGPTASSVCIGAWPKEAVTGQPEDEAKGIVPDSRNPEDSVLVLPRRLPDQDRLRVHDRDGARVATYAPDFIPVDATLIATMEKYPTRAVNGEVIMHKVGDTGRQIQDPSVVVRVPETVGGGSILRQRQPPPPALVTPSTPSQTPGAGKLKSIGQCACG